MKIGYACINTALAEHKICVNRSMIRKTFLDRGIGYASELALKNVNDLEKVIDWNFASGILLYRMSSDMFPWMSEYEIQDLPDYQAIRKKLQDIGQKVERLGMRLTFHPGPFNVLATAHPEVLRKTIKELRQHGEIMDHLRLPRSPFAKINIHIGAAYGDRPAALKRFTQNFFSLPPEVAARLTIENDDKPNMFSVSDLLTVTEDTGIPIVFDLHHHTFRSGDLTREEAMTLALATWPSHITPIIHYSSSRKCYEDPECVETAHADFIYEPVKLFGHKVDIMLEAKAKEQAALRYIRDAHLTTESLLNSP